MKMTVLTLCTADLSNDGNTYNASQRAKTKTNRPDLSGKVFEAFVDFVLSNVTLELDKILSNMF